MIQRHGPFFLLAAAVIGACLFSSSLILPFGNGPGSQMLAWRFTPLFGLPVALALWGWKRMGPVGALLWIIVMTGAHFAAIQATVMSGELIPNNELASSMVGFGIGGAIGGGVSLFALVLLGRKLIRQPNLAVAGLGALLLATEAATSSLAVTLGSANDLALPLFVPWQLVFGLAILGVVQGRVKPASGSDPAPFLPPARTRWVVITCMLASAALLTFTLANPNLLKTSGGATLFEKFSPAKK